MIEISHAPIIAQYIEFLGLWDRRPEEDFRVDTGGLREFREDDIQLEGLKNLLYAAEYFAKADLEQWLRRIISEDDTDDGEDADELYATIALLSLLPNLKTLQLPDRWYEVRSGEVAEALVPSVESLVSLSNSDKSGSNPLKSLETLLPFVEEGYDVRVGLQCLQPFMMLQSIRNLFAVSCVAVNEDWGGIAFEWPQSGLMSPLTRIEFACCCMDATGLAVLLSNTPSLTIFRYSHQTKWDGLEFDWNPGEFLETIANYCGEHLLELAITIDELHGAVINGLSSFMRLPKLQKLEVDVAAFCGPPLESGQRLGRNATIPAGATAWAHIDIPCMGDMLPDSICELHVNTDFPQPSEQALRSLFKNIKDRRMDKLLSLHTTIIRQYLTSTAQDIAVNHEVIFNAFDEGVVSPRPRSMMPQWKRNFDHMVGGIAMVAEA
ncbi:Nn.00g105610.m01.CDS01 [Neocucurbitaria sp. VM-36]